MAKVRIVVENLGQVRVLFGVITFLEKNYLKREVRGVLYKLLLNHTKNFNYKSKSTNKNAGGRREMRTVGLLLFA